MAQSSLGREPWGSDGLLCGFCSCLEQGLALGTQQQHARLCLVSVPSARGFLASVSLPLPVSSASAAP